MILVDLFTLPKQVRKAYEKAESKIIDELLLPSSHRPSNINDEKELKGI
ncbi:hypothetical protein [Tepidanaerobacter syntrophicus]|nr:hypothetical protein [Tepidanaerobacter syntrophicus]HHV83646.1 hypothetical protein [Tepidanaerobacter syntrophicus]